MIRLRHLALALFLAPAASAQLGDWHQSPTRPEMWFARFDLTSESWVSGRAKLDRDLAGLPVELASIASADEEAILITLAGGPGDPAWIGFTDFETEGEWRWLDGSPVTYTNFGQDPATANNWFEADFAFFGNSNGETRWGTTQGSGSGNTPALIGLVSDDCDGDGEPDLFEIWNGTEPDVNGNGVIDPCDVIGTSYCSATVNSAGLMASITAGGSATVAMNDFYLVARDTPPFEVGLFLASTSQDFVPLFAGSNGNLCLGDPIVRLRMQSGGGILFTDENGFGLLPIDLSLANAGTPIQPGETWNFQCWTRDIFSSNTSDATTVLFQ